MIVQYGVLLSSRLASSLFQAIAMIIVARQTSVSEFGVLAMIISIYAVLGVLIDAGLGNLISRAEATGAREIVLRGMSLNLWISVLFAAVVAVTSFAIYPHSPTTAAAVLLLGTATSMEKYVDTIVTYSIARQQRALPVTSVLIRRFTLVLLILAALPFGNISSVTYAGALAIGALLSLVQAVWYSTREKILVARVQDLIPLLRNAFPFMIANLSAQARFLDSFVVGTTGGVYLSGIYSAGTKLTAPFMIVPQTLTMVLLPHAARAGTSKARRLALIMTAGSLLLALLLLPIVFVAPTLVDLLIGSEYSDAASTLAVAAIVTPLVALPSPLGSILQANGRERYVATNGVTFAILTLAAIGLTAALGNPAMIAASVGLIYLVKAAVLLMEIWRLGPVEGQA